jgi:hypothetical protein
LSLDARKIYRISHHPRAINCAVGVSNYSSSTRQNYAAKSIDEVCDKLVRAALYIERNPRMVKSMTSFPFVSIYHQLTMIRQW